MSTGTAPRRPARTVRVRGRFEGIAQEADHVESPTGSETTFRIILTAVTDARPLTEGGPHPPPVGPLLDDQRIEAATAERTWFEWVWNVEVESYDFDYATRRITGIIRFDRALPPAPPPMPVVPEPMPVVPVAPTPTPSSPPPVATRTPPRKQPVRDVSPARASTREIRWWALILLFVIGLVLTSLVTRLAGADRGLVMAVVTAIVLLLVFIAELRRPH